MPDDDTATVDNMEDSAKLDQIPAQLVTLNKRLDSHDTCIARTEKFQSGDTLSDKHGPPIRPAASHTTHSHGGDKRRPPRYHKLEFPTFDGEEDPLPWLNRCKQFFRANKL